MAANLFFYAHSCDIRSKQASLADRHFQFEDIPTPCVDPEMREARAGANRPLWFLLIVEETSADFRSS